MYRAFHSHGRRERLAPRRRRFWECHCCFVGSGSSAGSTVMVTILDLTRLAGSGGTPLETWIVYLPGRLKSKKNAYPPPWRARGFPRLDDAGWRVTGIGMFALDLGYGLTALVEDFVPIIPVQRVPPVLGAVNVMIGSVCHLDSEVHRVTRSYLGPIRTDGDGEWLLRRLPEERGGHRCRDENHKQRTKSLHRCPPRLIALTP